MEPSVIRDIEEFLQYVKEFRLFDKSEQRKKIVHNTNKENLQLKKKLWTQNSTGP